jgi:hypothetical protein
MNLHDLAVKYGSDKAQHNYLQFYERYLPKQPKKLLEIGVLRGSSIKMWRDYFPGTEIHGLDLFFDNDMSEVYEDIMKSVIHEYDVKLHKGNQCDWQLLDALRHEDFDIIIDDGSHNSRDQLITFFGLFNGKQYYIEDIHCADQEFYSQGLPLLFRANNLFKQLPANVIYDCQSPIVLIENI